MKRIILTIIIVSVLSVVARAQGYDTVSGPDGKLPGYYYSCWYDEEEEYYDKDTNPARHPEFHPEGGAIGLLWESGDRYWYAKSEYTPRPMAITGIGVWYLDREVYPVPYEAAVLNNPRVAEYINVYKTKNDTLDLLAEVRWDTAQFKILKLPFNEDSALFGFRYCKLYEAHLDTPIVVDSVFYMLGTRNNNKQYMFTYLSTPTIYGYMTSRTRRITVCGDRVQTHKLFDAQDSTWEDWPNRVHYGTYMVMVDFAQVEVSSDDTVMGTAGPSVEMSKWTDQVITATPNRGYRFSHWNDGDTNNPRIVYLTSDTSFTAYFDTNALHTVEVGCTRGMGHVEGGGEYYRGETATLTAVPEEGWLFRRWNDGVRENPRTVVVTQDTLFTASFFQADTTMGIDEAVASAVQLTPNPTSGAVSVVSSYSISLIKVYDLGGRVVMEQQCEGLSASLDVSGLAGGTYIVAIHTPAGVATKKLEVAF